MNNSISHKFHHIGRVEYQELLTVSHDNATVGCTTNSVSILDLIDDGEISSPIAIKGRYIAGVDAGCASVLALQWIDTRDAMAAPGSIDAHLHIESNMITPVTSEIATLSRDLTTVIYDPHEIVNMTKKARFAWSARRTEQARQDQYLQISSCVPALEGCDANGANLTPEQMPAWQGHLRVTDFAKVMDCPGVISGQGMLLGKLGAFHRLTLDGHCLGLGGKELNTYITADIENCHGNYQLKGGHRKL